MSDIPGDRGPQERLGSHTQHAPVVPLEVHHVEFTLRATQTIQFHAFKGSALRGALASCLRRNLCPQWDGDQPDPIHASLCPVCQLLTQESGGEEIAGDVRRPYTLTPPLDTRTSYEAGETWRLGLTLFGAKIAYLPYLALAIHEMGKEGVGVRQKGKPRGGFAVERIDAVHPLRGERLAMMRPGERMVHCQTLPVNHDDVMAESMRLAEQLRMSGNQLCVRFLTPTRINHGQHMLKTPEFFPFFKQVVLRVLDLCAQHGNGRPSVVLKNDLFPWMDAVRLVRNDTRWWDVKGYSRRLHQKQVLGGLVGSAVYHAPDWQPLLPWLVWGQSTRVGKNVVKGCGIFQLAVASSDQ